MVRQVLVFGATGQVGTATIKALAEHRLGYTGQTSVAVVGEIRAAVRNVGSKKAAALAEIDGVEIYPVDWTEPSTLVDAMIGVDSVFIIAPPSIDRADLVRNVADAAKDADVQEIVLLSCTLASKPGTLFGEQFSAIEEHVIRLKIPTVVLRVPLFYENVLLQLDTIKTERKLYGPGSADAPRTNVAVADVGAVAAHLLCGVGAYIPKKRYHWRTFTLHGPAFSSHQLAACLTAQYSKQINYAQISYSDARKSMIGSGVADWLADGFMECFQLADDGDDTMNCPPPRDPDDVLPDIVALTGRDGMNVNGWIASMKQMFV